MCILTILMSQLLIIFNCFIMSSLVRMWTSFAWTCLCFSFEIFTNYLEMWLINTCWESKGVSKPYCSFVSNSGFLFPNSFYYLFHKFQIQSASDMQGCQRQLFLYKYFPNIYLNYISLANVVEKSVKDFWFKIWCQLELKTSRL